MVGTFINRSEFHCPRYVYIDITGDPHRHLCWLVDDWWVEDDGPHKEWSMWMEKRKYKGVRKVNYKHWLEKKKVLYCKREYSAKELGFFGA